MKKHVNAHDDVQMQQQGNTYIFTYQKAKYTPVIVFFGMIVFGMLSLIPSMLLSSNALLLICTFVLPVVLYIIVNAKRKDGSFTISANNILVDGVDYARTNINVLFIKAPYSPEKVTPIERNSGTIIVSGSAPFVAGMGATLAVTKGVGTAVDAGRLISQAATRKIILQYVQKNVSIGFRYGDKNITLASGLAEATANSLYQKVMRVLEKN